MCVYGRHVNVPSVHMRVFAQARACACVRTRARVCARVNICACADVYARACMCVARVRVGYVI